MKNLTRWLYLLAGIACFAAVVVAKQWVFFPVGCCMLICGFSLCGKA